MTTNLDEQPEAVPPEASPPQGGATVPASGGLWLRHGHHLESALLPIAWVLVIIGFGLHNPSTFLTWANFANIFGTNAVLFVLAMALLVPLTNGDLDLSVAEIAGVVSMVIAWLNVDHHVAIVPAILIGVALGTLLGAINGAIVTRFNVNPFIITLATGTVMLGVSQWITNEQTIAGVSPKLTEWTFGRHIFSIPIEFYFGLVIMLIMWYVLTFTSFGQRSLFVGQSREVARLSGFKVGAVRFWGFVIAGFIAAIAGVLNVGTQGSATPGSTSPLLLSCYAGAFLGLTTIQPGRFNALGAGVSIFFLATVSTGIELLGAQGYVEQIFNGVVLVVAVVFSQVIRARRAASATT
jgi:ribose transport system permease protein